MPSSYVVANILSQTVVKPLAAGSGFNHSFYLELLERQSYGPLIFLNGSANHNIVLVMCSGRFN